MSRKKILITITIAVVLVILLFLFSVIFSVINMNNSTIFSGITINDIDVSGKTKEEAIDMLEDIITKKTATDIELSYKGNETEDNVSDVEGKSKDETSSNEYETTISFSVLDVKYEIDSAVTEAYNIGKTGNIFQNNFAILGTLLGKKNINIAISTDEDSLETIIEDTSSSLPNKIVQNSYYIEDNNLIITRGKAGITVDTDEFKSLLNSTLENISSTENQIIIPTQYVEPEKIDVDAIHKEVYKAPQDAYFEKEPFKVYAEVQGINFDVEKAKKAISEKPDEKEYTIPLIYEKPKVKLTDLDIDVFPDVLGKFSTRYDASNKGRSTNLKLAASKINGTILSPGEEFSYNKVVGERTIEAGYKEAKIYSAGQVVDGLGGGICQISSTLYNAVVFANLKVTQRYNHQFVTSYVRAGRDATVVYGVKDFKFVNNRTYPIKITMSVNSGIAKAEIHGIKEETEYDISFDVETVSSIPYTVKYIEDSSLESGKEKVKQRGTNGIIVRAYKVVKKNGVTVSRELISKDRYNAMQRIILKGTKKTNSGSSSNNSSSSGSSSNNSSGGSSSGSSSGNSSSGGSSGNSSSGSSSGGSSGTSSSGENSGGNSGNSETQNPDSSSGSQSQTTPEANN